LLVAELNRALAEYPGAQAGRPLGERGSFTSHDDLEAKVYAFIDYYNRMMAKLVKWTYQDKPLMD
jgi:hypothetical protein